MFDIRLALLIKLNLKYDRKNDYKSELSIDIGVFFNIIVISHCISDPDPP